MDTPEVPSEAVRMPGMVEAESPGARGHPGTRRTPATALFRRLFLLNVAVFVTGAGVLALGPATVSTPVAVGELSVLTAGLALMLAVNALLLRNSLRPLDGLTALMERVDLLHPGERLPVRGHGDVAQMVRTFNDMLERLEAERGASSARALAAQEGERERIARELHDEIGQSLTAVLLGLKRTVDRSPDGLREELRTVQETIRGTLDEVRQVARRLRPGVLSDLGLSSALSALAADFSQSTHVSVAGRIDPGSGATTAESELVIYRIAQESLTNIARHADASQVELTLARTGDDLVLRITDDGRGPDGSVEGAGIRGMRERALLIGARLDISTRTPGGTEVRLVIPVAIERE